MLRTFVRTARRSRQRAIPMRASSRMQERREACAAFVSDDEQEEEPPPPPPRVPSKKAPTAPAPAPATYVTSVSVRLWGAQRGESRRRARAAGIS